MRTYLERRAEDKDVVKGILDRLKQLNYLDDARYARQFVRLHTELRKQGPFRIARDLRARGVPDRHIEAALAERSAESNESAIVRERLERRIKSLRGPLDERRVASLYRSLAPRRLFRGHHPPRIERVGKATHARTPRRPRRRTVTCSK